MTAGDVDSTTRETSTKYCYKSNIRKYQLSKKLDWNIIKEKTSSLHEMKHARELTEHVEIAREESDK